jgi:cytochrome c oxidase subunit 3
VSAATTAGTAGLPTGRPFPVPPTILPERTLTRGQWGLLAFLVSEVALFGTLIVTYIFYLGRDVVGPTPAEALSLITAMSFKVGEYHYHTPRMLSLVVYTTACLLSSSGTVHLAERNLHRGNHSRFILLWLATIILGAIFLAGTAFEWSDLIYRHNLTISRNLFGTTYYTLVGLHALHVTGGVTIMLIVLGLALRRQVTTANRAGVGLVSWYWHFVDGVWVVVFTVVYLVGR